MTKADIHAHEILHMMEGNSYATEQDLRDAIIAKFGDEAHFCACSAKGLNIDEIIIFLKEKGKFKPSPEGGFTMDIKRVCNDY